MSALVYQAINAVAAELGAAGIAKSHRNEEGDYAYRSIDDVLAALAPLLGRHRLCILPRVLERSAVRVSRASQLVIIRAAFDLVSALDGSSHTIETYGEALDDSDKGTAKAMSAAYKAAMLQAFCVPVGKEDSDASSPRLNGTAGGKPGGIVLSEPPEGWDSWANELLDIAGSCESAEAIDRLTATRRQMLAALQRSRPELYATTGEAIAARLAGLQQPGPSPNGTAAHGQPKEWEKDQEQTEGAKTDGKAAPASIAGASAQVQTGVVEPRLVPASRSDEREEGRSSLVPASAGAREPQVSLLSQLAQLAPANRRPRPPMPIVNLPKRLERPERRRDQRCCPAHRAWIRRHQCCVPGCLNRDIECAHVRTGTDGGTGLKPSDRWAISLCSHHHREQHQIGEAEFQRRYRIDLYEMAIEFAKRSPRHWRLVAH